jgi:hypothetical protein
LPGQRTQRHASRKFADFLVADLGDFETAATHVSDHTRWLVETGKDGDAANFRHAFKRWTGQSPHQFRAGKRAPISDRSSLIPSLGSQTGDEGASVQAIEP